MPAIWHLEVANSLQHAVHRRRIDATARDRALADLSELRIAIDPETTLQAWRTTLKLAERHDLTAYDASYLELAQRRGLPLATLDRDLRRAAAILRVPVLGA